MLLDTSATALGHGLFIPVFFTVVGVRFDPRALDAHALRQAALLVGLVFVVKVGPALLFGPREMELRARFASGALLAAPLSLVVAIGAVGRDLGAIGATEAAAYVLVALVLSIVFPAPFRVLVRVKPRASEPEPEGAHARAGASRRPPESVADRRAMPEIRHPYAPIRIAKKLEVGTEVQLDAGATKSLRFREVNEKEAFTLRDVEGSYFRASVLSLSAERAQVAIYERMATAPESNARITLVCAVLARQRMLMVAQKATELGVARIVPVFSAHSVGPAGLAHEKAHAWPGQTLRAARQCRRASVPEMRNAIPLERVFEDPVWQDAVLRYTLDDRAETESRPWTTRDRTKPVEVVFAVGPEGGWSDAERVLLQEHGARPLRLGGRVLRAETAVLVGLTVLQYTLGDLAGGS